MPTSESFESLYKRLNLAQKQAVDTIDGPVMVIAGPGTGKTQILALRIANILKQTDTAPESILALTFTESAVHSMRSRLLSIVGNAAYKIPIYTFHGFANQIIKSYPDEFSRIIGAQAMTDIDQIRIIQTIIDDAENLSLLRPYGDSYFYIRPILNVIKNLKREALSSKDFEKIVVGQEEAFKSIPDLVHDKGAHKGKMKGVHADLEKKIKKNRELLLVYKAYEQALLKERLYDYEDMIIETIKVLESNENLLLKLQEEYQYILADEHQDANQGQNTLLKLLSGFHSNPNLFIVGDEKQAIFRFQGASLDNFLYFKKLHPTTKRISLTDNYRSTQQILDGAHSLIEKNVVGDVSLRQKLMAAREKEIQRGTKAKITILKARTIVDEHSRVIAKIEKSIREGVAPGEIAVIYRENRDALPFIAQLQKSSIPFVVHSDRNVLADDDIQKLIMLLRAINEIGNDEFLAKALAVDFLNIPPLDVYRVFNYANKTRQAVSDVINSAESLKEAGIKNLEPLLDISKKLSSWAQTAKNTTLVPFIEKIVSESGFLSCLLRDASSIEKNEAFGVFFREAEKISESKNRALLSDLLAHIDILESHSILLKAPILVREGCVNLMTAHKSKGQEFEQVYILGATDGHWGNKREIRYFHIPVNGMQSVGIDPVEDERRLFYVALTRAKKEVYVSYAAEGFDGKELLPSQFIGEIDSAHVQLEESTKDLQQSSLVSILSKKKVETAVDNKEYFLALFLSQGLSVTALNAYIRCPWEYFFNNLLRLPKAKEKHQLYGTAVHETLKIFFDRYRTEEDLSRADLLELFENYLKQKHLGKTDFQESLIKGTRALGGYYDFYKKAWPRNVLTEFQIGGVEFPLRFEGKNIALPLRGNLDKIEFDEREQVTVVDYKTGAPRSRNSILGQTKTSEGDYYRQLLFYKLLLDSYDNGKFKMKAGVIDFVEPEKSGAYKQERFEISAEDTKPLQALIAKIADEILTLSFWDVKCDEAKCNYCALRRMIKA